MPLAGFADRLDQLPLAHLGAAGNPFLLRELVELLAVPVLEPVTRLAAPGPSARGLLAELAPRARRQVRNRPFLLRAFLRGLHVLLRGLDLLPRSHSITSARAIPAAGSNDASRRRGVVPRPRWGAGARSPDLALPRGRAAALAARGLLLRGRAALLRGALGGAAGAGLLAASARRARRVRDLRRALLRHAFLLELLVLLLVLDVCALVGHVERLPRVEGRKPATEP